MTVSAPKWTSVSVMRSGYPRSYTQDDIAILLWTGIDPRLLLSVLFSVFTLFRCVLVYLARHPSIVVMYPYSPPVY